MGTSTTVSLPVPSSRPGLGWRGHRVQRFLLQDRNLGYLFLFPAMLVILGLVAYPFASAIVMTFQAKAAGAPGRFIGLGNYRRMFADPIFISSLETTLLYLVVVVPGLFVVSLLLALLIRQQFPLVGLFRSMLFAPNVVSLVVIALIWKFMLTDQIGFVDKVFHSVGLSPPSWLGNPHVALWTVIGVTIWFSMGYYMLIFLSGLQDIPREYYEVARIDGAGSWQTFWNVTWPLLKPTSFFILLTSTVAMMTGGLDLLYVMTSGGPANSTTLVIYYIYQQAFVYGEYGYASAIGAFIVAILLVWSGILFAVTKGGRFSNVD